MSKKKVFVWGKLSQKQKEKVIETFKRDEEEGDCSLIVLEDFENQKFRTTKGKLTTLDELVPFGLDVWRGKLRAKPYYCGPIPSDPEQRAKLAKEVREYIRDHVVVFPDTVKIEYL